MEKAALTPGVAHGEERLVAEADPVHAHGVEAEGRLSLHAGGGGERKRDGWEGGIIGSSVSLRVVVAVCVILRLFFTPIPPSRRTDGPRIYIYIYVNVSIYICMHT